MVPTIFVLGLLGCVLLPLPTPIIDLLLSLSLSGSLLLLSVSLTIRRTTDFMSFPALLLLATLFRLTLNISTTRLILSDGDAGRVIDAFAGVVVRNDPIVGGVMFIIITIVQFVVIARGAERVAEVGARFALDGLPGHQAAIDADVRSGVVTPNEAARRRAELSDRSNFYGAMDGTVRFVRGDATAGLAITAINLVGGVLVGVVRQGLPWQESVQVYGRLTIGDGLLSQIPAVLVSLAAGLLVARVDRSEEHRGRSQLLDGGLSPSLLIVPAVFLLGLALSPNMPRLAFIASSAGFAIVASVSALRLAATREASILPTHARNVSVHLRAGVVDEPKVLERALAQVRLQCSSALGLQVPGMRLVLDAKAEASRIDVRLEGRALGRARLDGHSPFEDQVVIAVYRLVMENAAALVDLEDIDRMVDEVRVTHPIIVRRAMEVVELTDVLAAVRGFLSERVPLPPLRFVLGVMAEGERFRDPQDRASFPELVRARLADHWVHAVMDGLAAIGPIRAIRLTPDAEGELVDALSRSDDGWVLRISTDERQRWRRAMRVEVSEPARTPLLVIATPRARKAIALLLSGAAPHIPVVSTAEVARTGEPFDIEWVDGPVDVP